MAKMSTVVETVEGPVDGKRGVRSRKGTTAWLGIPFAAPPVGDLRFRAPQPVEPWPTKIRTCHEYGPTPVQEKLLTARTDGRFHPRSEDCLTLNVFAPDTVSSTPRPVMFFIYGGGYMLGGTPTPIYDGSFLARARDVIVVTVNYRFGPFGFIDLTQFSTPDRQFDSNLGIRDVVAGLEWVQRNIAAFGGDPDRVTVFGESAGGAAVLTLLSLPSARGLFSQAIAESPAPDLVVQKETATIVGDEFVRQLVDPERRAGAERTEEPLDPAEVARIIDGADAATLHRAGKRLLGFAKHAELSEPLPFAPVVDGDYLPKMPVQAALDGDTHPVPLIIGSNRDEGELFKRFWDILPESGRFLVGVHDPEIRDEIDQLYPGTGENIRLSADAVFWVPTTIFAQEHAKRAPTWMYRYDYAPRALKLAGIGATHATELFAVFGTYRQVLGVGLAATGSWSETKRVTTEVQGYWSRFARTGNPGFDWPQYDTDDRRVLVIDDPSYVVSDPDGSRRAAWEKVHLAQLAVG
ncbi:MAG: carboxylesterase/lipase family protein [Gordonia sp. (in: high G+C Gram-positive bacteria)]|uniref:carboxylesterase/lipase family protein n=1 Tax=Gordonia sp. (in: high G+C Gram-positive bacteria) TaxID=84139 RepID=UPI0039E51DF3